MAEKYNWEWENNINSGKELIDIDSPQEHKYNAWRTNTSLSNFRDAIFQANKMNINHHLSSKLQYHYLYHSIRKQKRFGKKKTEEDKHIENQIKAEQELITIVQDYYKYNIARAKEALKILSKKHIDIIRKNQEKGD